MGFWYWFRVGVMVAGLAVVILAMRRLNQTPSQLAFRSKAGAVHHGQKERATVINLCPTRVTKVEVAAAVVGSGGALGSGAGTVTATAAWVIFEEGMRWFRTLRDVGDGPSLRYGHGSSHPAALVGRQTLDPVAVEKWFSRNCTLNATRAPVSADVKEALKVYFVSGEPQVLLRSASAAGEYEWMGQAFGSPQMDAALKELGDLPASN